MSAQVRPGYKLTEVGVIPEDWEVVTLGDVVDYTKGFPFRSADYTTGGVRIIRVSDTTHDSISDNSPIFISPVKSDIYSRWSLSEFDIILSTVGSKPPMYDSMVGKAILVQKKSVGALLNQNAVIIRNKKCERSIQVIIVSHLKTNKYFSFIEGIYRGNANQASITLKDLFEFVVPMPVNHDERQAIAAALFDIDALISRLDQLIAKKRDIKQAAMQQLLSGQQRLPGFSGEWEKRLIGDISFISKGEQLSQAPNTTGIVPHYNGGVSASSYIDSANTPKNTIIISEGGNSCGFVQFITTSFWCGGHCYSVRPRGVDNIFLYFALKAKQEEIMGLRVGSGLPNIQKNALNNFQLMLPINSTEQTTIANILSDMDAEISTLEAKHYKTRQIKLGMMQELLTGRTRLK